MTIADFSAPKSFAVGICCALGAYFLYKSMRLRKPKEPVLFFFWICTSIFYVFLSISTLAFYFSPELSFKLYYGCLVFAGLQVFPGIYYLFQRVINRRAVKIGIIIIFCILFAVYLFYVFSSAKPAVRYGEPILETNPGGPQGYLGGFLILPLIVFPFFFIWKDFQKGIISWDHLGEFYRLYAFILYMTISLIRIFYFLPHPWYLEIFYMFIPYLMYRDYKEAKNDQKRIQKENLSN